MTVQRPVCTDVAKRESLNNLVLCLLPVSRPDGVWDEAFAVQKHKPSTSVSENDQLAARIAVLEPKVLKGGSRHCFVVCNG